MNVKQRIETILSGYNRMVVLDPSAANEWLEEKIDKLQDDEREELTKQMVSQNLVIENVGG